MSNTSLVRKKGKDFPYWLPRVGPGADPGVQAVSPKVTWSRPPGSRLPLLSARPAVTFPAEERHRPSAGIKLYCLMTESHACEQLAQGWYLEADRPRFNPATFRITRERSAVKRRRQATRRYMHTMKSWSCSGPRRTHLVRTVVRCAAVYNCTGKCTERSSRGTFLRWDTAGWNTAALHRQKWTYRSVTIRDGIFACAQKLVEEPSRFHPAHGTTRSSAIAEGPRDAVC